MIDTERAWAKSLELSSENSFYADINYNKGKFWNVAKRMQEESEIHGLVGNIKIMRAEGPLELVESRNEFFEKTINEQIRKVRNFLSRFDIPENELCLPTVGNEEQKLVRKCTIKLLPSKYFNNQNTGNKDWVGWHQKSADIDGDIINGLITVNLFKEIIFIKEDSPKENLAYTLLHELIHQVFLMSNLFSDVCYNNAFQNLSINEGSVEFLTQIIAELESDTQDKAYKNEVSLIYYLITEISKNIGIIEAIRQLILWGYKGGTQNYFVLLCREIKSESFPNGFDCYDTSENAINELNNFLIRNNGAHSNLSFIINEIRTKTTPHRTLAA